MSNNQFRKKIFCCYLFSLLYFNHKLQLLAIRLDQLSKSWIKLSIG